MNCKIKSCVKYFEKLMYDCIFAQISPLMFRERKKKDLKKIEKVLKKYFTGQLISCYSSHIFQKQLQYVVVNGSFMVTVH